MDWTADDIVRRYCADHDATWSEGMACFNAFKQYMVVCAHSETVLAPSEAIDDMWHTALLFTRSYQDFCHGRLGKFIHHQPLDDEKVLLEVYAAARNRAEEVFGELDSEYWTDLATAAHCGGCGSIYTP